MRPFLLLLFLFLSIVPPLPAAPDQRILLIAAPSLNDDAFVVQIQFGTRSFSVVLIGKDGGEKLRRATPLSPEELFAIVDAMPMRRAEMRGQK